MADIPVEIWQLARDGEGHDIILLRDASGRVLPITIGVCEAAAMWVVLSPDLAKPYVRRPWSHDLLVSMMERLDATLERVVIDGFTHGTFYATLHLVYRDQELMVDARPSDAICLLLRMSSPLFVNAEVMDDESYSAEDGEGNLPDFGATL